MAVNRPPLGPHLDFLIECARPDPDEARLEKLADHVGDWETLLRLATDHGLVPVVAQRVRAGAAVPGAVGDQFMEEARTNAIVGLGRIDRLFSALDRLADAGIKAMPFKGPVLGSLVHRGATQRSYIDLDVLVREHDARRAKGALSELGYRHVHDVEEAQEAGFVRARHVFELYEPTSQTKLELHWRLVPKNVPFPINYESLWSRSVDAIVHGRRCRVLSAEDRLLYLCVHGSWHQWRQFKWIIDVAAVCQTQNLDRSDLRDRARTTGTMRMLRLGCLLAERHLGTEVPIDTDDIPTVERLADRVERGWTANDEHPFAPLVFRNLVRERYRDRLRHAFRMATQPMPADFSRLRLPSWLVPIYAVVRPAWLVRSYGREFVELAGKTSDR